MEIAIGVLLAAVAVLSLYLLFLERQLRLINRQLVRRLSEHTTRPVSLALFDRELNRLCENINRSLKAEETLRLEGVREEKNFRELIANLSHDLRTPLTAVKGYQQLVAKGPLSPDQRAKLETAGRHADELGRLIEHFFEYSALLTRGPSENMERINLTNLAAECLAGAVPMLEKRGLSVHFDDSVPVFAAADREYAERIMENLVRNCALHSAGDVNVRIFEEIVPQTEKGQKEAAPARKAVVVFENSVENPEKIDPARLFDRFCTGDKSRAGSTGLGLSIVKLLAEKMGGTATADIKGNRLSVRVEMKDFIVHNLWLGR